MNIIDDVDKYFDKGNADDHANAENKKYNECCHLKALTIFQIGRQEIDSCADQGDQKIITYRDLPEQMFYCVHPALHLFMC
jgi:hypothetical protein